MKFRLKHQLIRLLLGVLLMGSVPCFAANRQFYEQYDQIRVSGPSMLDTLKPGELTISYKLYPYRSLRLSDIVVYNSEKGFSIIHRIFKRYRGGLWITKGDNNRYTDRELLGPENFKGLVLVDVDSIKRFRKLMEENGEAIPGDVENYMQKHMH